MGTWVIWTMIRKAFSGEMIGIIAVDFTKITVNEPINNLKEEACGIDFRLIDFGWSICCQRREDGVNCYFMI